MPDTSAPTEPNKPPRRWFQFDPQAVLIVAVIVAAAFIGVASRHNVLKKRDTIVKSLVDRGGTAYRIGHPVGPVVRFLFWDQQVVMTPPKPLTTDEKQSIAEQMPSDTVITEAAPAH